MDEPVHAAPRCKFHERIKVEGGYRYELINIEGPHGFGRFVTAHPPAVGDLIGLWDAYAQRGGTFRVIERMWLHSGYGSTDWPHGSSMSKEGPLLDIVVEAAEGLFVDEVSDEAE